MKKILVVLPFVAIITMFIPSSCRQSTELPIMCKVYFNTGHDELYLCSISVEKGQGMGNKYH